MTTTSPAVVSYLPSPINERTQVVHAPGGTITLHVRQWETWQAELCRRCSQCQKIDGPGGQTVCIVPWEGRQTLESIRAREVSDGIGPRLRRVVGGVEDRGD